MKLYAKRWTAAWGWQWIAERDVTAETADGWLHVFRKDEPDVTFVVSSKKPRIAA